MTVYQEVGYITHLFETDAITAALVETYGPPTRIVGRLWIWDYWSLI